MIFVTATFGTFSTQAFARRWRAIGHASISSRLDVYSHLILGIQGGCGETD
jgi:hypothetical protein